MFLPVAKSPGAAFSMPQYANSLSGRNDFAAKGDSTIAVEARSNVLRNGTDENNRDVCMVEVRMLSTAPIFHYASETEDFMTNERTELVALTAEIVNAFVSNNTVAMSEVPTAITQVYAALGRLGSPAEAPAPEKPVGAVSVRASIKPDRLISMIDGKSYKMLRRHLRLNGYTPESYRAAFGLPDNYPMVAADYAEKRRALAIQIGLGRKPKDAPAKPKRAPRKPK